MPIANYVLWLETFVSKRTEKKKVTDKDSWDAVACLK